MPMARREAALAMGDDAADGEAVSADLEVCIDAEIARARLQDLVAELDDRTVLRVAAIVQTALGCWPRWICDAPPQGPAA